MLRVVKKYDANGIGLIIGGILLMVISFLLSSGYSDRGFLVSVMYMELDVSNCDEYYSPVSRYISKNRNINGDIDIEYASPSLINAIPSKVPERILEKNAKRYRDSGCAGGIYVPLKYFLVIGFMSIGLGAYIKMTGSRGTRKPPIDGSDGL